MKEPKKEIKAIPKKKSQWAGWKWSEHPNPKFASDPALSFALDADPESREAYIRDLCSKHGNGISASFKGCYRCGRVWAEDPNDEYKLCGDAIFSASQFKLKEKKSCRMCVKGSWDKEQAW